jgi:hypothetical protein
VRITCALLLGLGLALPGLRADPAPPEPTASTAAVKVGDSYDDVVAKLGKPTSEINAGSVHLLYYPTAKVKLRDGLVADVTDLAGGGPNAGPAAVAAPAAAPIEAEAAPTGQARARKDAVESEIAVYEFGVLDLFRKNNFPELDRMAFDAIKTKAKFGDGSWKIMSFHQALMLPPHSPAAIWDAEEETIGKWENTAPGSINAKVAHVQFLNAYAWEARGDVPAAQVSPANLALFQARTARAQEILQAAAALPLKSPMLWYAGLTLAVSRHWTQQDTFNFFVEGKKSEPEFWYFDTSVAYYLLPKWNGKPGDWEAFAAAEAVRPGSMGSEGYARIVWSMKGFYRNVFKQTKAQWGETRDGFQVLMQKYPESLQLVNEYAFFACNAGDKVEARKAFDKMGNFVDPFIWTAQSLAVFRAWAYKAD